MTLQALRYQYPNGHKYSIDDSLRRQLSETALRNVGSLPELHRLVGVQIRPCILFWQVLRLLEGKGQIPQLSLNEVQTYLMRCSTHGDTNSVVEDIITMRRIGVGLPPLSRGKRNSQDWFKFLIKTDLFEGEAGAGAYIKISNFGLSQTEQFDLLCSNLTSGSSFWIPGKLDKADRKSWYSSFGSIKLGLDLPPVEEGNADRGLVFDSGDSALGEYSSDVKGDPAEVQLRDYSPATFTSEDKDVGGGSGVTIDSSYDAGLSNRAHRLHDLMVIMIGNTCRDKGAIVREDPKSVDLLVSIGSLELIVEVKSVNPENYVKRIRYAIGQLHHYDYLLSLSGGAKRRKMVGLAATLSEDSWTIPFINAHIDFDLASIEGSSLIVHTTDADVRRLFA